MIPHFRVAVFTTPLFLQIECFELVIQIILMTKTNRNGYKVSVWYRPLLFNATLCRIEVSNFQIESLKVTIVYLVDYTPIGEDSISFYVRRIDFQESILVFCYTKVL